MNAQPHLHKHDRILTADDVELGQAITLYQRREEANPALKLYAAYLKVFDFTSGGVYYIPLDFLETASDTPGAARLSLTFEQVKDATYNRMPNFVAWQQADRLPLAG